MLEVVGLRTRFTTGEGDIQAVDGVSFQVPERGAVALVGESGCGKTATALSLMRLLASPQGRIEGGQVRLRGEDLLALPEARMRQVRGDQISMVFQEPMTSLNPVLPVGEQVAEVLRAHRPVSRSEAARQAVEGLRAVGIPDPEERASAYPHQLSGGMRQRVVLAMALACQPALLIADEPTTALDVTIQAQILELLRQRREKGMALLLITHSLGVVAETCQEVLVMYAGRVVEQAPAASFFAAPAHPYSAGLLNSHPSRALRQDGPRRGRLRPIPGQVPAPGEKLTGCRFRPRCARASPRCQVEDPVLAPLSGQPGRQVACFHPLAEGEGT